MIETFRPCINVSVQVMGVLQRVGADATDMHFAGGAMRRLCGNGARSTSRLRTRRSASASAAPPSTAHALLSAAMLTAAKGSAAGAGVSDAPRWVPRGRHASIEASKVAGKGTPLHHWGSQKNQNAFEALQGTCRLHGHFSVTRNGAAKHPTKFKGLKPMG